MAFIIKWNLFIGIVAFMAYVVQKIMGKRLGHYWRKVVWILLTIKMCFPFWSVTEKFRQHFFIISMPAYYMGEQNQKTAIMTKIGNVSIREWMSGEKFLPYIWLAGMILCLLFHAIQYRIWKKRIFAECKRMQKNSVLEALKKASEVCKIKKTEIWVCENQDFYSPMLFGVRNTKVLIPQEMLETENYSYEEWYLIFLHELTHQKKHDLWYKRFLQIIRDVYWFCIPMLWVQKMANIDIECVCYKTYESDATERLLQCYFKSGFKTNEKRIIWSCFNGIRNRDTERTILQCVFSKKKTSNIRHCFSFWNNYFEFFGNANSATNMVIIAYRKLSQMQSCGTRRSGLECMGK